MAKGTVNWDSQETWQRVVAAIIATGVKIDYKRVALHFGTTYDTIENRFRKIKKEAAVLKEEVERGDRDESIVGRKSAANGSPRKSTPKSTPKKDALSTVSNGRISKKSTPKNRKKTIKEEAIETSFDDIPGHFHGDDGLGGRYGDFNVNFDDDHLSSDFL